LAASDGPCPFARLAFAVASAEEMDVAAQRLATVLKEEVEAIKNGKVKKEG